jgi:hypothetical protein
MKTLLSFLQGKLFLFSQFHSVIYVMTLGLICFTVYIVVKSRMSIRDYIPVSFSDDGDDDGN